LNNPDSTALGPTCALDSMQQDVSESRILTLSDSMLLHQDQGPDMPGRLSENEKRGVQFPLLLPKPKQISHHIAINSMDYDLYSHFWLTVFSKS